MSGDNHTHNHPRTNEQHEIVIKLKKFIAPIPEKNITIDDLPQTAIELICQILINCKEYESVYYLVHNHTNFRKYYLTQFNLIYMNKPDYVSHSGTKVWRYWSGNPDHPHYHPHRVDDLPAIIWPNGTRIWAIYGQYERQENKPLIFYPDESKGWIQNGGLKVIYPNNTEIWYHAATLDTHYDQLKPIPTIHRSDGPAVIQSDGTLEWWNYGERHNEEGPAISRPNGLVEWWINGICYEVKPTKKQQKLRMLKLQIIGEKSIQPDPSGGSKKCRNDNPLYPYRAYSTQQMRNKVADICQILNITIPTHTRLKQWTRGELCALIISYDSYIKTKN